MRFLFFFLFITCIAYSADFEPYNKIIGPHVEFSMNKTASKVNYNKINLGKLKKYNQTLLQISRKTFDRWEKDKQLAFLINLYNQLTIQLILEKKPEESIKEIGNLFKSTWKIKFFDLFGEKRHLDYLEHTLARESGRYQDPRIHFAFNCASIGCPALQKEPFLGKKLDKQLNQATFMFLQDRKRNYFDLEKKTLFVSKIFDWYEEDFKKGHKGFNSLKDFFAEYAEALTDDPESMDIIQNKKNYEIDFVDYNWELNNKF